MGSLVQAGNNSSLSCLYGKYGQTESCDFHTCMWKRCEAGLTHCSCRMCVNVCGSLCIKELVIEPVIPLVCISLCSQWAVADLLPYLVKALLCSHLLKSRRGTSRSLQAAPSTQTASPTQPKLSHRHLLYCRPSLKTSKYSLFCGPDTTSSPSNRRGEEESSEKNLHNHRLTRHLSADLENKQRIHVPKQTGEKTHYSEWNQLHASKSADRNGLNHRKN